MYQVMNAILRSKKDKTKVTLIFANITVNDILLHNELQELEAKYPDRLSIYYVLNNAPEGWTGGVGFITADMIRSKLPAPGECNTLHDCHLIRQQWPMRAVTAISHQQRSSCVCTYTCTAVVDSRCMSCTSVKPSG